MAISVGSATTIYDGAALTLLSAVVANDDVIGSLFEDVDSIPAETAYILFNRQTLTAGSKSQIEQFTGLTCKAFQIVDNSVLTLYNDSADSDGWGRIITNSGLVPAQQPEAEFFANGNPRELVGAKHTTLAVGLLAFRDNDDAFQTHFEKFTVASGNVSFSDDTGATNSPTAVPLALEHWAGNKFVYSAYITGLNLRILDTTTGITEHSVQSEGSFIDVSWATLSRIDDSRMLCFFFNETDANFYACVATLIGTATIIFGSVLTVHNGSTIGFKGASILRRSDGKFTIGYPTSLTNWTFESLSVSGTTVEKVNDNTSVALGSNALQVHILGFLDDAGAIVYRDDSISAVRYRPMDGLPVLSAGLAKFYHGLGSLAEKFTLPFAGVQPGAMTLDKSLGTVVMGQNAASAVPIVYSAHPYATGTAAATGMPTGTSISSLKWV